MQAIREYIQKNYGLKGKARQIEIKDLMATEFENGRMEMTNHDDDKSTIPNVSKWFSRKKQPMNKRLVGWI